MTDMIASATAVILALLTAAVSGWVLWRGRTSRWRTFLIGVAALFAAAASIFYLAAGMWVAAVVQAVATSLVVLGLFQSILAARTNGAR